MCCTDVIIGRRSKLWMTSDLCTPLLLGQLEWSLRWYEGHRFHLRHTENPKIAPKSCVFFYKNDSDKDWQSLIHVSQSPLVNWIKADLWKDFKMTGRKGKTRPFINQERLLCTWYSFFLWHHATFTFAPKLNSTCYHPKLLKRPSPRQQKKLDGENDFQLNWPVWRLFNSVCGGAIYL